MKTVVFCARGFETIEFSAFIDVLGWARNDYGYPVDVETCGFTKQVLSTFNIPITVDKTIDEINVREYDALAIPGGFEEFGFYEEAFDERFLDLIKAFNSENKIIASICVGALPVAKSGVLTNRRATTYRLKNAYRQKQLKEYGAKVINKRIVIDNNIITSYCPETAPYVAFELLNKLIGKEKAGIVKKAMGYK
jgi:protein deglycase